jgi:fibronectin-binding autotransporter adhesin
MKTIALSILAVVLIAFTAMGQNMPIGSTFTFNGVTAASGGTFGNADSAPTWTMIKNGSTVCYTGTFTVVGTGTLAGDYYGSASLSSGSFSAGDRWIIESTATISSVPVKFLMQGRAMPAEATTGYPKTDMALFGGSATPVTNLTNAGASWTGGTFDSGMSALVSSRGTSTFANGGTVTAAGGTIASAGSITASVPNVTLATATAANGSILVTSGTGANQLYVQSGGVEVMSLGINSAAFDSAALATLNIQGIGGGSAGGNNIVVTAVTIGTFGSGTTSLGYGSFSSLHSNGSVTFASFNPGTTTFAALSLTNASSLAGLTIGTVTNLTNAPAGITMGSDATHTWMSNGSATVSLPAINSSGTLSVGSYSLVTGGGSGLTIGTNYITTGSGTITFPAGFGTLTLSNISANDWGYGTRTVNGGTISGGAGLTPTQGKWLEDIWRRTPGGE